MHRIQSLPFGTLCHMEVSLLTEGKGQEHPQREPAGRCPKFPWLGDIGPVMVQAAGEPDRREACKPSSSSGSGE